MKTLTKYTDNTNLKRRYFKYFFLCVTLFLISCEKEPISTATISGIVKHSGTPLSGVNVVLSSRTINSSTSTGSLGEYKFDKLPRGDYKIVTNYSKSISSSTIGTSTIVSTGSISAQINRDGENINANIEPSWDTLNNAVIKGVVHDAGSPIWQANVTLSSGSFNRSTVTGAPGEYGFDKLPRGIYQIDASFSQYLFSDATGTTSLVGNGTVTVQINRFGDTLVADIATTTYTTFTPAGGGGGSCPYIYAFNGESYIFNGDIFAGAIYPSLERDDYTQLIGLKAVNGEYKIKITNELQERQYTNLAELLIVNHKENVEILFDKYGKIQTLSKKQSPHSALSPNGIDYLKYIDKQDNVSYLFDEISNKELSWFDQVADVFVPQTGKNSLVLTFDKPTNKGKLIVRAKNSNWSVLLWHKFIGFFGNYYTKWSEEQNLRPIDELLEWRLEEGIPIMVSVETENGWEYVDCFNIVGSVTARDMVMPLELSKIKGNTVKLKLECAFMFWELDYVAMDFTENADYTLERISASGGVLSKNKKLCKSIRADDNLYLEHLNQGREDVLTYSANHKKGCSIFLHSKGYYESIIKNDNEPEYLKIIGFMRPGSFAQFSLKQHQELSRTNSIAVH